MGSITVRDVGNRLITLVFSNLQKGEWIYEHPTNPVIRVWMDDNCYDFNKNNFPDEESWDMVLQCTGLEDS